MHYGFDKEFNDLIQRLDLFEHPALGVAHREHFHPLLRPTRHVEKVHLNAKDSMSPVCAEWLAALRPMMNFQVLTSINGIARCVVKYIVKLDKGYRCTVCSDANTEATIRVENQFLQPTKILKSRIYKDKTFKQSRKSRHVTGRAIAFVSSTPPPFRAFLRPPGHPPPCVSRCSLHPAHPTPPLLLVPSSITAFALWLCNQSPPKQTSPPPRSAHTPTLIIALFVGAAPRVLDPPYVSHI